MTNLIKTDSGDISYYSIGHYDSKMRDVYSQYLNVIKKDFMWNDRGDFYYLHGAVFAYPNQFARHYALQTADGMIWAMKGIGYTHNNGYFSSEIPGIPLFGLVVVDLDGDGGPSRLGVDIHEFFISKDKVYPRKNPSYSGWCNINQSTTYNGRTCGNYILKNHNMDYLDGPVLED